MKMPVLLIAIGNTRIKAMVCDLAWLKNTQEQDFDRQTIATYAYTHDRLDKLIAVIADLAHPNFDLIFIASVVPHLKTPWHNLPQTQIIATSDIPLNGLYSSMGVDRALAAFGAGEFYGYPILVIDAGTAITLTAIASNKTLIGGAIIAGLRSQFDILHQKTAALPILEIPEKLPTKLAKDTHTAIQTGIAHMLLMGLQVYIDQWRSQYPQGKVVMTGGDAVYFQNWGLAIDAIEPNLIFWGMINFHKWHFQHSLRDREAHQ